MSLPGCCLIGAIITLMSSDCAVYSAWLDFYLNRIKPHQTVRVKVDQLQIHSNAASSHQPSVEFVFKARFRCATGSGKTGLRRCKGGGRGWGGGDKVEEWWGDKTEGDVRRTNQLFSWCRDTRGQVSRMRINTKLAHIIIILSLLLFLWCLSVCVSYSVSLINTTQCHLEPVLPQWTPAQICWFGFAVQADISDIQYWRYKKRNIYTYTICTKKRQSQWEVRG